MNKRPIQNLKKNSQNMSQNRGTVESHTLFLFICIVDKVFPHILFSSLFLYLKFTKCK